MKKGGKLKLILRGFYHYVLFFLLCAFVVTCTITLFVTILSRSLGIELTGENLNVAAKLTLINVIFLSFLFTVIDAFRRHFTTNRVTKHIAKAATKITDGDFSVRIEHINSLGIDDNFNEIIDCFNTMAGELSSVETLRADFVSNVSHELKTPLSVIQNYGTLLQNSQLDDEKRVEYAKGITDASRKLDSMMTNILKLNRLENQQIYPKSELYDLGEQLCECILNYESVWESKNIDIETNIEDNVEINADRELLSLVWNNLLSNAFKFTDDGGSVSISLYSEDEYAVVSVKDTGCGMSADVGNHIFDKFYQGDTSRSTQGNGLGLALVKRVVDIVKGDIYVDSILGEGSTFTVKIRRNK